MKRKLSVVLSLIIALFAAAAVPSYATEAYEATAENTKVVKYFEDGSYITIETIETENDGAMRLLSSSGIKSGKRVCEYTNRQGEKEWEFILKGSFKYDGKKATAVSASASYKIYKDGWKCTSKKAVKSGATVKGTAKFKYGVFNTKEASLSLKCSPTGKLS